jgi:acyl-CoA dehydrogenase
MACHDDRPLVSGFNGTGLLLLAAMWAHARTTRFADGPDEVHRRLIGRLELRKYA